ncbi:hypothetical protein HDU76_000457 [Blyttiomyces sp. JEL0837]|nr:hypothetical protein HDU76_000457 [Blyttiomyces sp. JEL0837]
MDANGNQILLPTNPDPVDQVQGGTVQVHWSIDNWKTIYDTPAVNVSSNQTWTWKVPVASVTGNSATLPTNVTFAIKYASSAGTFWDNNFEWGSIQNYNHALAPICYINNIDPASTIDGLLNLNVGCYSDLKFVQPPPFRLDKHRFKQTSSYFLNSTELSNGPHVAEVQAVLDGSKTAVGGLQVGFNVKNTVKFLDQWAPLGFSRDVEGWSVISDDSGAVYIGDNNGTVHKFAKYGDATAVKTYSSPLVGAYINQIGVDASQNVYVLTSALSKFFANGTLDMTFGTNGSVTFYDQSFGSSTFCYAGFMNVVGGFVFISDTCNERIVKLSIDSGAFLGEFSLKTPEFGIVSVLSKSTRGNLLVSRDVNQEPNIIFEMDPSNFGIVGSLQLETYVSSVRGISVTSSKYFISDDSDESVLIVDATNGKTLGKWTGSGGVDGTPGHFGVLRGSLVLSDGSFAAMSVGGAALQRFSQTLLV